MSVDRDTEIAIELLCEHVAVAVERVERGRAAGEAVTEAVGQG